MPILFSYYYGHHANNTIIIHFHPAIMPHKVSSHHAAIILQQVFLLSGTINARLSAFANSSICSVILNAPTILLHSQVKHNVTIVMCFLLLPSSRCLVSAPYPQSFLCIPSFICYCFSCCPLFAEVLFTEPYEACLKLFNVPLLGNHTLPAFERNMVSSSDTLSHLFLLFK